MLFLLHFIRINAMEHINNDEFKNYNTLTKQERKALLKEYNKINPLSAWWWVGLCIVLAVMVVLFVFWLIDIIYNNMPKLLYRLEIIILLCVNVFGLLHSIKRLKRNKLFFEWLKNEKKIIRVKRK